MINQTYALDEDTDYSLQCNILFEFDNLDSVNLFNI